MLFALLSARPPRLALVTPVLSHELRRDRVRSRGVVERPGAGPARARAGRGVERERPELGIVPARPLEVVSERPVEVAPHVGRAVGDRALERRQVIVEVLAALGVGGVGETVLGYVHGYAERPREREHAAE